MDSDRRRMLLALALVPVAGRTAAAAAPESLSWSLRATDAAAADAPPLRYGDGPGLKVLRLRRDVPTGIVLDNRLARPTSLDLHGLRVPAPLGNGTPLAGTVAPGSTAEVGVRAPDSGTFWFHPGITDMRYDDTAAGLGGVLVVEDAAPLEVDADLVALLSEPWRPDVGAGALSTD